MTADEIKLEFDKELIAELTSKLCDVEAEVKRLREDLRDETISHSDTERERRQLQDQLARVEPVIEAARNACRTYLGPRGRPTMHDEIHRLIEALAKLDGIGGE